MGGEETVEELGGTPGDSWQGHDGDDRDDITSLVAADALSRKTQELDDSTAMVSAAVDEYLDEQAQPE